VCHYVAMRLHISLSDDLVAELDRRVGRRRRSAFIGQTVRQALDDERRWEDIEAALEAIPDTGHEWDDDPAAWVRAERAGDARRVG
jgi:predicted transcriptional regulator